ncbi:hypothetical protein PESP_a1679 [Pseudoalteromonas espejiana DSM 9414]|nr:hypothetical protein PESP_a1679 [Pseudoalteromonas espejiana DSM 9414]
MTSSFKHTKKPDKIGLLKYVRALLIYKSKIAPKTAYA